MSEEEFEKELKINDENWREEIDRLREVDQNEIIKLRSIIKEVREYIKKQTEFGEYTHAYPGVLNQDEVREINRILDKENNIHIEPYKIETSLKVGDTMYISLEEKE